MRLYGIDPGDPSLYDAVIYVEKMGPDGAAEMICKMIEQEPYRTTPESQARLQDRLLEASVKVIILDTQVDHQGLEATASEGRVLVRFGTPRVRAGSFGGFGDHYAEELRRCLLSRTAGLAGFTDLEIESSEE